jgi:hypothetical protein
MKKQRRVKMWWPPPLIHVAEDMSSAHFTCFRIGEDKDQGEEDMEGLSLCNSFYFAVKPYLLHESRDRSRFFLKINFFYIVLMYYTTHWY